MKFNVKTMVLINVVYCLEKKMEKRIHHIATKLKEQEMQQTSNSDELSPA
jgi:23S rRNA A2030 N6-methylase RlmJ